MRSALITEKINFTKSSLERINLPAAGKRLRVYDLKQAGLLVDVTPAGRKTFYVRRKLAGETIWERIGPIEDISIEQARGKAAELCGKVARGENPSAERLAAKKELTLAELFEFYIETHAKKTRKTWKDMEKDFERKVGDLKTKKVSKISSLMAEELHSSLARTRGPYAANRTVQLLRAVYNKGKRAKVYSGDNPFEGITLFEEKPRERFLSMEEAVRLLVALETEANDTLRDFLRLSLFTGLRKHNLMSLRWDYINLSSGVLKIPDTKNGTSQTIALGEHELAIFKSRAASSKSPWVFPGSDPSKHITDMKRSWTTLRQKVQVDDCTIHDLRRSLGAGMASANVNIALVKDALHHKDIKTTLAVYARTQDHAVRSAKELVQNQWLESAGLAQRVKTTEGTETKVQ